ncbi:hypothetical protein THAOC_07626 [Thalassiosira oceanica]|uniref:Uncharacterized protein n=1 Tax=Thalassiosira oceanica TaxID=159749 RepID=K0SZV0_THAOC|nr:hypothetical protein THAOC_07626 [Thalassiosira oceanica]|eukprot:EJK70975.1 hypothetical protein THAOC_07626 [Thalassiosira oceanica]
MTQGRPARLSARAQDRQATRQLARRSLAGAVPALTNDSHWSPLFPRPSPSRRGIAERMHLCTLAQIETLVDRASQRHLANLTRRRRRRVHKCPSPVVGRRRPRPRLRVVVVVLVVASVPIVVPPPRLHDAVGLRASLPQGRPHRVRGLGVRGRVEHAGGSAVRPVPAHDLFSDELGHPGASHMLPCLSMGCLVLASMLLSALLIWRNAGWYFQPLLLCLFSSLLAGYAITHSTERAEYRLERLGAEIPVAEQSTTTRMSNSGVVGANVDKGGEDVAEGGSGVVSGAT